MRLLYLIHENIDKKIWDKELKRFKLYQQIHKWLSGEHGLMCGFRNKDKVFYIIRPCNTTQGLMSMHNYVLWKIRYALGKGYVPVVDFMNYGNMYLDPKLGGKINSWEYYFEQPTEYGLKEALRSRNVIICDKGFDIGYRGIDNTKHIILFNRLIHDYCRLNKNMLKKISQKAKCLFPVGKRIIGVVGRGTDYSSLHPYAHAIVPDTELLIHTIDEKLVEWEGEYIFLATEDKEIYSMLKNRYGEKLLSLDVPRFQHNTNNKHLSQLGFERENDRYLRGEEYLITVYLLAQCNSIITSAVGAGLAAIRINGGKYEHKYIFDLGVYDRP